MMYIFRFLYASYLMIVQLSHVEDDLDNKPDMLQPQGVQHLTMAAQNYSSGYVFMFCWHNITGII